jgi:hypothetical protein
VGIFDGSMGVHDFAIKLADYSLGVYNAMSDYILGLVWKGFARCLGFGFVTPICDGRKSYVQTPLVRAWKANQPLAMNAATMSDLEGLYSSLVSKMKVLFILTSSNMCI